MRIALVQKNLVVGDVEGNAQRLLAGITEGARGGADLALCSELALTGYPPKDLLERPAILDANERALERLAREAPIPAIVGYVSRANRPVGRCRR